MRSRKNLEDKEILEQLLFALKINKKTLSERLGYKSPMSIYYVEQGRNLINDNMIDKIIKEFPQVNYMFLKKGEYPILKNKASEQIQRNVFGVPETQKEVTLEELKKLPERVRKLEDQVEFLLEQLQKQKSDQS